MVIASACIDSSPYFTSIDPSVEGVPSPVIVTVWPPVYFGASVVNVSESAGIIGAAIFSSRSSIVIESKTLLFFIIFGLLYGCHVIYIKNVDEPGGTLVPFILCYLNNVPLWFIF